MIKLNIVPPQKNFDRFDYYDDDDDDDHHRGSSSGGFGDGYCYHHPRTRTRTQTTTTIITTIPEWIETMRYIKISLLALMFILIFCGNTFVLVALNVSLKQKFFFVVVAIKTNY